MHRRLDSPLHAARAGVGAAWCLALVTAALVFEHPLVLVAVAAAVVWSAGLAGVRRDVLRAARFAIPLALLVALINPLTSREGLTVLWRFGELPPFGQVDVTLEALVYGLVLGLRVAVVMLGCALFTAVVDPDELLRMLRSVSFRSGLTALLAVRLLPVLARDAQRLDAARRCRHDHGGDGPLARAAVVRAVAHGALERAVDVATVLEVRGYGAPSAGVRGRLRRRRGARAPRSRHDLAFAASATVLLAAVVVGAAGDVAGFAPYPTLQLASGPGVVVLCAVLVLAAVAPFAERRGIAR